MPIVSLRVPQLGEGLHEALLVELLKQPGDPIGRDEPIYVMETDKATTDVESPYAGVLVQWMADTGSVLAIGAEIARMEVAEGSRGDMSPGENAPVDAAASFPATVGRPGVKQPGVVQSNRNAPDLTHQASSLSGVLIPPKTRKYLKDHNLLDQIHRIPTSGEKMMPQDVDAYLAVVGGKPVAEELYSVEPLPKSQLALNFRLSRGAALCVPVTVVTEVDWTAVQLVRQQNQESQTPTGFAIACWAVVQAMKLHPKFRSSLTADGTSLRVFQHVNLGVAVALHNDELATAVIRQADLMTPREFFDAYSRQVQTAQSGHDQADQSTTLTMSNIGKVGIRVGIPAIVAPAVATLAIGEVYQQAVPDGDRVRFQPSVSATMTFDHRIINGVGAAKFIGEVRKILENFGH